MNLEALAVIGTLAVILGGILYLPFYLWFRWQKKRTGASAVTKSPRVTSSGIRLYGSMVVVLFVGFAQGVLAPETTFGQFMNTGAGWITWALAVSICGTLIEVVLTLSGHTFVERENDDV